MLSQSCSNVGSSWGGNDTDAILNAGNYHYFRVAIFVVTQIIISLIVPCHLV